MSRKIIKYGIIGINGMGANHANLLLNNKVINASLAAICDNNETFSKNFPERNRTSYFDLSKDKIALAVKNDFVFNKSAVNDNG